MSDAAVTEAPKSRPAEASGSLMTATEKTFTRERLSTEELYKLAARMDAELSWSFDEAAKRYTADTKHAHFNLFRNEHGVLQCDYTLHFDENGKVAEGESLGGHLMLNDQPNVAEARRAVTLKLVDMLNNIRRDHPALEYLAAEEPDLI